MHHALEANPVSRRPGRFLSAWQAGRARFDEHGVVGVLATAARLGAVGLTWPAHRALMGVIGQAGTAAVLARFPRVGLRYTLPYLSTSLGWRERRDCLQAHYALVNERFRVGFSQDAMDDRVEVWRLALEGGRSLAVHVQGLCPVTRHREGELSLCLKLDGQAIYKLSFSMINLHKLNMGESIRAHADAHGIYIGRVQGVSGAMVQIRQATALLGDTAPQDLLMAAMAGLAQALGVRRLIGVGDAQCVSHASIAASDSCFSYTQFWARFNAQVLEGGHHLIQLPLVDKPLSEVSAKHRKRTQRKREFKRAVSLACEQAVRAWLI